MPEQTVSDRYNRMRLVSANQRIREHFAAEIPADQIADSMFKGQPQEAGLESLAAMSLAETHNMTLGESFAVLPTVLSDAYGENYNLSKVVSDMYQSSEPYSVPTIRASAEEIEERVAGEEADIPEFVRQRNEIVSNMNTNVVGGFNQAHMIHKGVVQRQTEFNWFGSDPNKQEFYDGILASETPEEKDVFRKKRFSTLMGREIERLNRLDEWQRRLQETKENPPGVWNSKLNAWRVGSGNVTTATLDSVSDLFKLGSKVFDSSQLGDISDNMSDWARAYHKATQEPELSFQGVNTIDDMTNSLLANIPYTGTMVAAAMFSPDKMTPLVVFAGGAMMGSSSTRQTALDNGMSEQVANARGWVAGGAIGFIEASSGGAAKYNPKTLFKRIATFPGKLTKNALSEVFREEIPQEIIEMAFAGDTPRNADGTIDWDETTDRFLLVARDTAFMSTFFTSGSSVTSTMLNKSAEKQINKDTAQVVQNAFDVIVEETRTGEQVETRTAEEVVAQELAQQEQVTDTLQQLQAEIDAKKKIAAGTPLESAERELFPELAKQEDQIAELQATAPGLAGIPQAESDVIQSLVDKFDDTDTTVDEIADEIDNVIEDKELLNAVQDLRDAQTADIEEFGQRSDLPEIAEDKIMSLLREKAKGVEKPADVKGTGKSFSEQVEELKALQKEGKITTEELGRRIGDIGDITPTQPSPAEQIQQIQDKIQSEIDEAEERIRAKKDVQPEDKPQEVDDIVIESTPEAEDINKLVESTPRYGVNQQADGKYTVQDWESQKEQKSNLTRKQALRLANELNSGLREPTAPKRLRDLLPSVADMKNMTFIDLLNNVGIDLSAATKRAVMTATKNAMVSFHRDLGQYAKRRLEGLDITESQRNGLINKIASAKTPATQLKAIELVESLREVSRQKVGRATFNKIKALVNKRGKLRMRDGGIHHSTYDTLSDLIKQYTTVSKKTLNAIRRSKQHLDGIRKNLTEREGDWAEALMPKGLTNKFNEIMATPLKELSADQLDELNNTLKRYLKQSQLYNTLLQNRQIRDMKNFLNNAVAGVKLKSKGKRLASDKDKRGKFKAVTDGLLGIKNADIHTIAVKIWGRNTPIKTMMDRARRQQLDKTLEYVTQMRTLIQESGITEEQLRDWSPSLQPIQADSINKVLGRGPTKHTVKIGGRDVSFTMAELMAFTMNFRNSYNLRQMIHNGIETIDTSIGKITEAEAAELLDIVSSNPQAKAFVDGLSAFYIKTAFDGNEVSRKLDGIELFNEQDYYHVEYVSDGGVMGVEYVRDSILDEEGRLKGRVGSGNPVAIRDIFQTIQEDINVMSTFVGMAETVRRLRSLANYKPFKQKMKDVGGKHVKSELDSGLRRYQLTRQKPLESLERAVQNVTSGAARGILMNPGIAALQPTSALLYGTEASPKYIKAIFRRMDSGQREDVRRNWTMFSAREQGLGSAKTVASPSEIKKTFTGVGTLADRSLGLISAGDMIGITKGAQIVFAEMSDDAMNGVSLEWWQNYGVNPQTLTYGSDSFWQAFNDRADYMVSITQPMFFSENRSAYTGSDNVYTRSLFRFRSFIDQAMRIVQRNVIMRGQGEISNSEMSYNIGLVLGLVSVISPLFKAGFKAMLGDKPEAEELLTDMLTAPLSMIPLLGYPMKRITASLIGSQSKAKPHLGVMPLMVIDRILEHSSDIARGLNASLDDEFIQSGPNKGEKKSEVLLKKGIVGLVSDVLLLNGVPITTIERIKWWKN